jgi:hypothetical protein
MSGGNGRDVYGEEAAAAARRIMDLISHPDYKPVRTASKAWGPEDPRISKAEDARDFPEEGPES